MKLEPVTKLENKKIEEDVMSENCGVIAFFLFMANLEQFGYLLSYKN